MILKEKILDNITSRYSEFSHVQLDLSKITKIKFKRLKANSWDLPFIFKDNSERSLNYLALFSVLSFCYWNSPFWGRIYKNNPLGGSYSLFYCLTDAIKKGYNITDPYSLRELTFEDFQTILKGDNENEISFIRRRYEIVKSFAEILIKNFNGSFLPKLNETRFDANSFHEILINEFRILKDEHTYKGKKVGFYKKSQEIISLIYEQFKGKGLGAFTNMNSLTASSDYKLPQVLNSFGILNYQTKLLEKINQKIVLSNESEESLEIRMCTILACSEIQKYYAKRGVNVRDFEISNLLWTASQYNFMPVTPHPRIFSTWV